MKILIVEDDRSMAQMLTVLMLPLKKEFPGSEVDVVHNFEDAKRIIQGMPAPDIALLDLSLPPLRHEQTIARLHEIEGRCAIVIVTGHPTSQVRELLGDRKIEIVHKTPRMRDYLFTAMHTALSRFQGKERLDAAYEEAWDRLRALKSSVIPPDASEA
jgi:DNA-binding response OmpR family regulator